MKRHVLRWGIGVIAVVVAIKLAEALGVPLAWKSVWGIVIFVPVLALVNAVIGSVLRVLSLPITCMTFGLFSFVINAIVFMIAGRLTGAQLTFWGALFGSIVVAVVSAPLSAAIKERT